MTPHPTENINVGFAIECVTFPFLISILILQVLSFNKTEARFSKYVKGVILASMGLQVMHRIGWTFAVYQCFADCFYRFTPSVAAYSFSRVFTFLFYIHRAKLSQGMQPVCAEKYFTKIFPGILMFVFVLLFAWTLMRPANTADDEAMHCFVPEQNNVFALKSCAVPSNYGEKGTANYPLVGTVVTVEVSLTAFFLFLFLKPLRDMPSMGNAGHQRLRRMVQINVIGTFCGMAASNVTEINIFAGVGSYHFDAIGVLINMSAMFMMLKRNREYFKYICCMHFSAASRIGSVISFMSQRSGLPSANTGSMSNVQISQTSKDDIVLQECHKPFTSFFNFSLSHLRVMHVVLWAYYGGTVLGLCIYLLTAITCIRSIILLHRFRHEMFIKKRNTFGLLCSILLLVITCCSCHLVIFFRSHVGKAWSFSVHMLAWWLFLYFLVSKNWILSYKVEHLPDGKTHMHCI